MQLLWHGAVEPLGHMTTCHWTPQTPWSCEMSGARSKCLKFTSVADAVRSVSVVKALEEGSGEVCPGLLPQTPGPRPSAH